MKLVMTITIPFIFLISGCSTGQVQKTSYLVACVQIDSVAEKNQQNVKKIEKFTRAAASQGAEIIIFHEGTVTDYVRDIEKYSEYVPDGPSCKKLEALAKELKVYLSFGLSEKTRDKKYYITQVFMGPKGFVYKYRKTWLWKADDDTGYRNEWAKYDVGDGPEIFYLGNLKATCFICSDGDAPRCIDRAKLLEPEIVFYPNNRSSYLGGRKAFAEKAVYINAPMLITNRVGKSWAYSCKGGCAVIDSTGKILAETKPEDKEKILFYDLSIEKK